MSGKTIEVLVPVSGAGFSYGLGVHKDVPKEIADDLVKAGHARIPGAKKAPPRNTSKAKPKTETRKEE